MSRLGANVTGIDASEKILMLRKFMQKGIKIKYICSSPEKLQIKSKFDVILNINY